MSYIIKTSALRFNSLKIYINHFLIIKYGKSLPTKS